MWSTIFPISVAIKPFQTVQQWLGLLAKMWVYHCNITQALHISEVCLQINCSLFSEKSEACSMENIARPFPGKWFHQGSIILTWWRTGQPAATVMINWANAMENAYIDGMTRSSTAETLLPSCDAILSILSKSHLLSPGNFLMEMQLAEFTEWI